MGLAPMEQGQPTGKANARRHCFGPKGSAGAKGGGAASKANTRAA